MNVKIVCSFLILLVASLTGCTTISSSEKTSVDSVSNSFLVEGSSLGESGKTDGVLVIVSEEEQLKNSDLVYQVIVTKRGEVEFIDNQLYTVYYFEILEVIKGEETINHAYFRGNTTENSSVTSSTDEKLIENENYKLYLRNRNDKYMTTAGYQSIIKQ